MWLIILLSILLLENRMILKIIKMKQLTTKNQYNNTININNIKINMARIMNSVMEVVMWQLETSFLLYQNFLLLNNRF